MGEVLETWEWNTPTHRASRTFKRWISGGGVVSRRFPMCVICKNDVWHYATNLCRINECISDVKHFIWMYQTDYDMWSVSVTDTTSKHLKQTDKKKRTKIYDVGHTQSESLGWRNKAEARRIIIWKTTLAMTIVVKERSHVNVEEDMIRSDACDVCDFKCVWCVSCAVNYDNLIIDTRREWDDRWPWFMSSKKNQLNESNGWRKRFNFSSMKKRCSNENDIIEFLFSRVCRHI